MSARLPVLVALLSVSAFAQWYARSVSLPRYCDDPAQALVHLERIIEERSFVHELSGGDKQSENMGDLLKSIGQRSSLVQQSLYLGYT